MQNRATHLHICSAGHGYISARMGCEFCTGLCSKILCKFCQTFVNCKQIKEHICIPQVHSLVIYKTEQYFLTGTMGESALHVWQKLLFSVLQKEKPKWKNEELQCVTCDLPCDHCLYVDGSALMVAVYGQHFVSIVVKRIKEFVAQASCYFYVQREQELATVSSIATNRSSFLQYWISNIDSHCKNMTIRSDRDCGKEFVTSTILHIAYNHVNYCVMFEYGGTPKSDILLQFIR